MQTDLLGNPIATFTYVNVYRRAGGKITAQSLGQLDAAIAQADQANGGKVGTKCIARIRVPVVCVEGQFDI